MRDGIDMDDHSYDIDEIHRYTEEIRNRESKPKRKKKPKLKDYIVKLIVEGSYNFECFTVIGYNTFDFCVGVKAYSKRDAVKRAKRLIKVLDVKTYE